MERRGGVRRAELRPAPGAGSTSECPTTRDGAEKFEVDVKKVGGRAAPNLREARNAGRTDVPSLSALTADEVKVRLGCRLRADDVNRVDDADTRGLL